MTVAPAAAPSGEDLPAADLLALLDVSLTALTLLRPLFGGSEPGAEAEIADFACIYLNPAGQRMLGVPTARPAESLLTLFPGTREAGTFAFYRRVFETGEPGRFEVNYQADGLDNYFYVAARRHGDQLVVSFTDTAGQDRSAVETALRASQAAEADARAEADGQRQRLAQVLTEMPAQVATYRGPDHVFAFVNPRYQSYFPGQDLLGRPLREVLPETAEQGILARLDRVYQTGELYQDEAVEVWFDFARTGQRQQVFLDLFFHPLRDARGEIVGVLDFSYDVTERVRARRALDQTAGQLRQLNDELEERVEVRTQALRAYADEARRAHADAEQQRASLVRFLSQTKAAICVLRGPAHLLDYCNPTFERLFSGVSLLPGRPLTEVFPGAVAQELVGPLDEVFRSSKSYFEVERELVIVPPADGQPARRHYFTFSFDAYQEQGRTAGVSIFAYDVTEAVLARRQNEALQAELLTTAGQRAQERGTLYGIFEQTPALIVLLRGPEHRIEYHNAAYQQLFAGRELLGRPVSEMAPEAVPQGFVALLDRVYATGETYFGVEMPFVSETPDEPRQTRYFNFTFQRLEKDGQPVGISEFAYDVTEQVLARRERESQQQQLRELFEQAPVAIGLFAGPDYVVEVCNPGLQAIWRRTAAEVLDRPLFEVLPEVRDQGFRELLDEVRRTGTPFVAAEMPGQVLRNGQAVSVHLNFVYQPIRDAQGRIRAVAAVAADVSEQVAARRLLARTNTDLTLANEQLTRTNADLDSFVYVASHDLKQPIANIEGLLTALREHLPAEAQAADHVAPMLDMMQAAIGRFQLTLRQLTDVSRLQQAQAEPAEAVDLTALAEGLRLDLAPLLARTAAGLHLDVAACPQVLFAPGQLRSILYNLLSNAINYQHPDRPPLVTLRCRPAPGGATVLEVQDNGLGLSEAQQSKLFGLFVRLHDHVEGTGIGLYMVRKMVENAGGTIAVVSQSGVGSTFTVTLPGAGAGTDTGEQA